MWLLDTNVLSEVRRHDRAHPNVIAWIDQYRPSELYLSVITILEIEAGTLSLLLKDPFQGAILRQWIDERVLPAFKGRILPVDTDVALRCASLHVPQKRAERDTLIAATALVHGLKLVTRNVAHFEPTGVATVNPWDASPKTTAGSRRK